MSSNQVPEWLKIAQEIQALSQTGLHFSQDHYNVLRYNRLLELAAEIVASRTRLEREPVLENFAVQPGYATPKVDVRGALVKNNRILLVRELSDGGWCMPGGWADVGETPSEMVEREILEESGFRARTRHLIGVYDANRAGQPMEFYHAYKLIFYCEIEGGKARTSEETTAVDFFPEDGLPNLSSQRTNRSHIRDVFSFLSNPTQGANFD